MASRRTPGPQSLKWPLLSKETSPLDLLISRASLAAESPRQIPAVAVPAHSTQEACGQALGALAALPRWGQHGEAEQSSRRGSSNLTGAHLQSLTCRASGHARVHWCSVRKTGKHPTRSVGGLGVPVPLIYSWSHLREEGFV